MNWNEYRRKSLRKKMNKIRSRAAARRREYPYWVNMTIDERARYEALANKWWKYEKKRNTLGLDLTGIPHTKLELDHASDIRGDYRLLHPDDKKHRDSQLSAGEDRSTKVEFFWSSIDRKDAAVKTGIVVRNGKIDMPTWLNPKDENDKALIEQITREYENFKRD